MGAGRTETARALYGADEVQSGIIEVDGKLASIDTPEDAVNHGIGYLSEDRKRYGLALNLSVLDNAIMASYDDYEKGFFIHAKKMEEVTNRFIKTLRIKTVFSAMVQYNLLQRWYFLSEKIKAFAKMGRLQMFLKRF